MYVTTPSDFAIRKEDVVLLYARVFLYMQRGSCKSKVDFVISSKARAVVLEEFRLLCIDLIFVK